MSDAQGPLAIVAGGGSIPIAVAEAVMRRGVGLVELANGPDAWQRIERKGIRIGGGFPPHARLQVADEVELVRQV